MKRRYLTALITIASLTALLYLTTKKGRVSRTPHPNKISNESTFPLSDSGLVRKCINGTKIGRIQGLHKLAPFNTTYTMPNASRSMTDEESFLSIYKKRTWGSKESVSGGGSELKFTPQIIATLHAVVNQLKASLKKDRITMLDVPCGDMNWMKTFLSSRDDVDYTGVDIVPDLIAQHKKNFNNKPYKFLNLNIVKVGLHQPYDLVFSRMMTQHLHTTDVYKFLSSVSVSGSEYLLTTTFPDNEVNQELKNTNGRFRRINFELAPFFLSPPLCLEYDGPPSFKHFIGLWKLPLRTVGPCEVPLKTEKLGIAYYSCVQWEV